MTGLDALASETSPRPEWEAGSKAKTVGTGAVDVEARAMSDRHGLQARFHVAALHRRLRPRDDVAAVGFDALERLRLDALGAEWLAGIARNLAVASEPASVDPGWQPLLDSVRAALAAARGEAPRALDATRLADTIESLAARRHDQARFGVLARRLALFWNAGRPDDGRREVVLDDPATAAAADVAEQPVDERIQTAVDQHDDSGSGRRGAANIAVASVAMPTGDEPVRVPEASGDERHPTASPRDDATGYRVFTRRFDEEVTARALAGNVDLGALATRLERHVATQERMLRRLATAFARRLSAARPRAERSDASEGWLDTRRLSRLIVSPGTREIYREAESRPERTTVVTLLVDNSRSMLGRPILAAAAAVDIVSRALVRAGVRVEVLGYTTTSLRGGRVRAAWESAGEPSRPGRLNALRHIVYKSASESHRVARPRLGLMLEPALLAQNVDGEALLWAARRLMRCAADRRILLVVTDGAPLDIATLAANDENFLARHLTSVIARLQRDPALELGAIGIGHDVQRFYPRAVRVDSIRDIGAAMIAQLDQLLERYDA